MNKLNIFTTFIILSISISMNSQHIELAELGLSFDIPQGWTGQQQEDYIILGHETIPGLMILSQNKAKNVETLKNLSMETILEEGLFLEPEGDFNIISDARVEGNYKGSYQGEEVHAFAIGLVHSKGTGMNILILTNSDNFSDIHRQEAKKLARTVQLVQPKDADNTRFWKDRIVGWQLKYMHTSGGSDYSGGYSGTSDVVMINLCTNGQFTYYSNSNSSFDSSGGFGYANANKDTRGTYRIYSEGNSTYLDLQYENGSVSTYELTVNSNDNTLLDGSRYFVTTLEGCE